MLNYELLRPAVQQSDLSTIAQYMLMLMLRNMSSEGWVFTDPSDPSRFSKPGCIIASPSYPSDLSPVTQNYVWNWTRDAALAAAEIARAPLPGPGSLDDYVTFASICQENAPGLDTACYTIDGQPREGCLGWGHWTIM